jgi:hypothetical protein
MPGSPSRLSCQAATPAASRHAWNAGYLVAAGYHPGVVHRPHQVSNDNHSIHSFHSTHLPRLASCMQFLYDSRATVQAKPVRMPVNSAPPQQSQTQHAVVLATRGTASRYRPCASAAVPAAAKQRLGCPATPHVSTAELTACRCSMLPCRHEQLLLSTCASCAPECQSAVPVCSAAARVQVRT